jgi:tetratricopeptide (TPR) repeat protein
VRLSAAATAPAPPKRAAVGVRWVILGAAVVILAFAVPKLLRRATLPTPTPDAITWYDRGVEAMRDGTYAGARTAFLAAIQLFPDYAQAWSRLAEAHMALDDESAARDASLQASTLLPDRSRLDPDDRLRFEAASEAALRRFAAAAKAYEQLAAREPADAGRWLDLGRAQEAVGGATVTAARANYAKAVQLNAQYAPAHLRLGVMQARARLTDEGLASIDRAIDLYQKASKTEGEAEALLRKGIALSSLSRYADARTNLDRVLQLAAADKKCTAQGIRARIELARVELFAGNLTNAEELARLAVAEAEQAGLQTLAATGLIDLGNSLLGARKYDDADAQFTRAISLAANRSRRTENRAKLTQASLKLQLAKYEDAVALVQAPIDYFNGAAETRLGVQAQLIAARARGELDQDDVAWALTDKTIEMAKDDEGLLATALENRAGQLTKAGDLPKALAVRERIDEIHRKLKDRFSLPFDLANHAELLVRLGRTAEARPLITGLEKGLKDDPQAYGGQRDRLTRLQVLIATTERRFADAVRIAERPVDPTTRILAEQPARTWAAASALPPKLRRGWPS